MKRAFSICFSLAISLHPLATYGEAEAGPAPEQLADVRAICIRVIGLNPGESYFANCQKVLSQFLAQKVTNSAAEAVGQTCSRQGLAPGSGAFSICMLDHENEPLLNIKDGSGTAYPSGTGAVTGQSFYSTSFSVRWNRERYACASLGLIPNSGVFQQCVSELDSSFLPTPN